MNFKELRLQGAYEIELNPHVDSRGFFVRLFCREELKKIGFTKEIVQVNYSVNSLKGSFRGLHYQKPPYSEIKIIRCLKGSVCDILLDIRKNSPTFLQWIKITLSESNNKMVYIPEGFAHGFQTLENSSELLYFHTNFYNPCFEKGVSFKDPLIKLILPLEISEISEKDNNSPFLTELGNELPDYNFLK